MKRRVTLIALTTALLISGAIVAQNAHSGGYHPCGTDEQMAKVFSERPDIKAQWEANERIAEEQDREAFSKGYPSTQRAGGNNSVQSPPQFIIPVVFHIIHDYGSENISDAQVLDQMRILNEDFRKLNADTASIVPGFQGIAADAQIEFRLANRDPNGNCTNGIDRIASPETYVGDDGSKLNYWPRANYLNVWVVKAISSGAAGYAYLPGGAPTASVDGIIILSQYIGSIGTGNYTTGRALTHEIGHFLNLQHTWGSTNQPGVSCGNDGVTDTPVTEGWTSCNLTSNDVCNNNVDENVQNFMDYSYCYRMFTNGQRSRMHNALNSSMGQRSSLWTTNNLNNTGVNNPQPCAPIADFLPYDQQFVCAGGSITFTDISYNGQPNNYSWSFPGGTPSVSSDSVETVTYNTPGTYSVVLTVSNAVGSNTKTRTSLVTVLPAQAQYNTSIYAEGMENSTQWNTDWDIINPQGNGWTNSTTASATGSRCARLDNTSAMAGTVDEKVSPTIDLSVMNSPTMTFKVAFAQRTATDADRLRVYVSTDCGRTWTQRYSKSGATLSTANATSSAFVPNASQWRTETVTFNSSMQNASNVRVKFEFTSDGGNDIYIDDINISGATGVEVQESGISYFDVYPNPASDNATVALSLDKNTDLNMDLVDLTGRTVRTVFTGGLTAGDHQIPLNTEGLSSGVYLVRIVTEDGRYSTRRLIIE